MFAIPIGVGLRSMGLALVTWILIGLCAAVFAWQNGLSSAAAQAAPYSLGVVPAVLLGHARLPPDLVLVPAWMTPLTALFLHGGWAHIGGNMLFLWIFGKGVENHIGRGRFLAFYLACGIASCLSQAVADPTSEVPMIGASGAIAGVLAGFLWLFPRAKVRVLVVILIFVRIIDVPAVIVLGLWFAMQVLGAAAAPEVSGGVAFWAHLGGFSAGLALLPLFAKGKPALLGVLGLGRPSPATPKPGRGRPPMVAGRSNPFPHPTESVGTDREPRSRGGVSLLGPTREGDGYMAMASHSTASIAQALSGIDFPAQRSDLVDHAKKNNADNGVLETLKQMPDEKYSSMADVFKGVGQSR